MKTLFLGVALTLALSSSIASADENQIVGTWRVQSFVREVAATGERQNEFGEKPNGYIIYQPDGRMFFMLVGDNRAKPTGTPPTDEEKVRLFGTLLAYSGTYVVEGDKATHKIDLSWNQSWTGGDQVLSLLKNGLALEIRSRVKIGRRICNRMDIAAAGVTWAPESILDGYAAIAKWHVPRPRNRRVRSVAARVHAARRS